MTLKTPDADADGAEVGLDLRLSRYVGVERPQRVSVYDGFAGLRFGGDGRFRVRAGHMWLTDLGTSGALAGGLFEYRQPASDTKTRLRVGAFAGLEPAIYDVGYASGVRKQGGYVAIEKGFLRRHVVGYTQIRQGSLTERSVLSVTNFVPAGRRFFAYQAAEFDVQGPAGGAAQRGLSYFLANVRVTPAERVELLGTYNRGHSLDARRLTEDVLNGRPLTSSGHRRPPLRVGRRPRHGRSAATHARLCRLLPGSQQQGRRSQWAHDPGRPCRQPLRQRPRRVGV